MAVKSVSGCQLRCTTVIKVISSDELTAPHKAVFSYIAYPLMSLKLLPRKKITERDYNFLWRGKQSHIQKAPCWDQRNLTTCWPTHGCRLNREGRSIFFHHSLPEYPSRVNTAHKNKLRWVWGYFNFPLIAVICELLNNPSRGPCHEFQGTSREAHTRSCCSSLICCHICANTAI